MIKTSLPINDVLDELRAHLRLRDELVLQAPPGAGKTTMVPLSLLDEDWLGRQKILLLEPRRMAARTVAERMAGLLNEKVGETVGYRIRLESRVSAQTRIEVITEGVLIRLLQDDPELQSVGLIIFDEYHERNLNTDLGLALSLQSRELFRAEQQPLKLLIMSATLDATAVSRLLNDAPLISSEGRMFEVQTHYSKAVIEARSMVQPVVDTIKRAIIETDGSILVFLPGQGEIQRVQKELEAITPETICVLPLYGALSLDAQLRAIAPLHQASPYQRKIVLATDIAETSLTIDGISTVVDSGLCRQPRFDPASGMTRLHTRRISQASSAQRMGRAGRTRAGHCYRLWSESAQSTLEKQTPAEILQADLCPLVLQLLQWGINDSDELAWMDKPPSAAFNQALDLLYALGAIEHNPQTTRPLLLSAHGRQMAGFPAHPRLAHMLIRGAQINQSKSAAALATLLSDKDPLAQYGTDIGAKAAVLLGTIPCEKRFNAWYRRSQQQMKVFEQLSRTIKPDRALVIEDNDVTGVLISFAYPDRIAQRRSENRNNNDSARYLLSNGRAANLKSADQLSVHDYLAVAELGGHAAQRDDSIYSAASLNAQLFESLLAPLVNQQDSMEWDEKSARFVGEQQTRLGALVLQRKPLKQIPLQVKQRALTQLLRHKGLGLLPWSKGTRQWQARVECLRQHDPAKWPEVSDQQLLESLEHWLQPYLDGVNKLDDFQKLDLQACLSALLPWPLPRELDTLAPLSFEVPSGSQIKIDYTQSPPVLAVKLQEMFGCLDTPAIAGGRVKLLVHLLSPGGKPLQITQDLGGFWTGSYQDVKKEMKGRYPKHPWPDDPLQAVATRFTKHRKIRQ